MILNTSQFNLPTKRPARLTAMSQIYSMKQLPVEGETVKPPDQVKAAAVS